MAVIMPSGKAQVDWSPIVKDEEGIVKHASTNEQANEEQSQPVSDKEALYEIAQRVLAERGEESCGTSVMSEDEMGEFGEGEEGGEGGAKAALEKAEEAIEEAEEAIAEVKEEVCPGSELAEEEIEIPLGEEGIVEVELEEPEIPGETPVEDDSIVESEDEVDDIVDDEDDEDEIAVEASTEDDFIRISKISPANRKKLYSYWTQDLGYPADYCKLLVKDYEK